jgi:hypothetical protein
VAQGFLALAAAPEPNLEWSLLPRLVQKTEQVAAQPEQVVASGSPPEHSQAAHSAQVSPLQEL